MKPPPEIIAVRTLYDSQPAPELHGPPSAFRCFYCERLFPLADKTRDHVVPRSKGGKGMGNLVPACRRCNGVKGDRSPTLAEIEKLHREGYVPKF